jgi:hypothetical protein
LYHSTPGSRAIKKKKKKKPFTLNQANFYTLSSFGVTHFVNGKPSTRNPKP